MKPLTVCMFSNLYPPITTGSTIQVAGLSRELIRRGHKVVVITAHLDRSSPVFERSEGVLVYRLPAFILPRMEIALNFKWLNLTFTAVNKNRIFDIIKEHKPDILHAHNHMFDMAIHAAAIHKRIKIPFVLTIHTIIRHANRLFNFILQQADRRLLSKLVINQADVLICADSIVADYIRSAFGIRPTVVIPYGIEPLPSPSDEAMQAIRVNYGLGKGPIILSLGHMHSSRDRRELIEILPDLIKVFPDIKLLIVGSMGTNASEKLAGRLGVKEHIIFTGEVAHTMIPAFIGIADVEAHWFVTAHPHHTPGVTGLEVMAAGKVHISNADQDIYGEDILKDGENILLIDPSDKSLLKDRIIKVLKNDSTRGEIGLRAQETVRRNFSWEMIAELTTETYRNVLAGNKNFPS